MVTPDNPPASPLQDLDEWEDDLLRRYPKEGEGNRKIP